MCKKTEELVANQFEKLTGVTGNHSDVMNLEVYAQKREPLTQLLRQVLPDLRISTSLGLVKVSDFAAYIERQEEKKDAFFKQGLAIVREITGKEYGLDDDLYHELRPDEDVHGTNEYLSQESRYFLTADKVYRALSVGLKGEKRAYYPPTSLLEKAKNIREIIDLYYRRGRF